MLSRCATQVGVRGVLLSQQLLSSLRMPIILFIYNKKRHFRTELYYSFNMELQIQSLFQQLTANPLLLSSVTPRQLLAQLSFATRSCLQTLPSLEQMDDELVSATLQDNQKVQQEVSREQSESGAVQEVEQHDVEEYEGEEGDGQEEEQDEDSEEEEMDPEIMKDFADLQHEYGLMKQIEAQQPNQHLHQLDPLQQQFNSFIEKREERLISTKPWQLRGEVTATSRPKNSILEYELEYKKNTVKESRDGEVNEDDIQRMIKQRTLDQLWDDRQRVTSGHFKQSFSELKQAVDEGKDERGLAELYQADFAQKVGITKSSDPLKDEINTIFKQLCYKLDALTHFNFKPRASQQLVIQPKQGIIFKEHALDIVHNPSREKVEFIAQKELNKHSEHLKMKRQMRQRKKQKRRSGERRKIQHGGLTKHMVQVQKKIKKNTVESGDYSKSTKFFKRMQEIAGKRS